MIVIQDVTLQRGTKVLLDKASVTLNPGERVARNRALEGIDLSGYIEAGFLVIVLLLLNDTIQLFDRTFEVEVFHVVNILKPKGDYPVGSPRPLTKPE